MVIQIFVKNFNSKMGPDSVVEVYTNKFSRTLILLKF